MELPKTGEVVSNGRLVRILEYYGKQDILAYLHQHGFPEKPFASDGCTMWPDEWRGRSIYRACFFHDVRYWCGMRDDEVARVCADADLVKDSALQSGDAVMARAMFFGVSVGGTPQGNFTWSWGYGRER